MHIGSKHGLWTGIFLAVAASMSGPAAVAQTGCPSALIFASYGSAKAGFDQVRVDTNGAENAGNEIGRFWQSMNSMKQNNFEGGCPSSTSSGDALDSWWDLTQPPLRGISGVFGGSWAYSAVCLVSSCEFLDMTLVVEDRSVLGDDALFIGMRVDATPALLRVWDFSRVDPSPSPSVLVMQAFPAPIVTLTHPEPSGDMLVDLEFPDIAANVWAVHGTSNTPWPASAVVAAFDLYEYVGFDDPGREVDDWTLIESQPYVNGPGERLALPVNCPDTGESVFVALGVTFEGGAWDVPSKLVGRAVRLECPDNSAPLTHAGSDQVVECSGAGGALVTLDGGATTDPQGDALSFQWSAAGVVFDDPSSITPTGSFPSGTTVATLTVSDGEFAVADTVAVTVVDTVPPVISCSLSALPAGDDGDSGSGNSLLLVQVAAQDACGERTLVAQIDLGWASLSVNDGQPFTLQCEGADGDAECTAASVCEGTIHIRGQGATLEGQSSDASGNVSTCALQLCKAQGGGARDGVQRSPGSGGKKAATKKAGPGD